MTTATITKCTDARPTETPAQEPLLDAPTLVQEFHKASAEAFNATVNSAYLARLALGFARKYAKAAKQEHEQAGFTPGRQGPNVQACRHAARGNVLLAKATGYAGLAKTAADHALQVSDMAERAAEDALIAAHQGVSHNERLNLNRIANNALKTAEAAGGYAKNADQFAAQAQAVLA